jgi:hypothetical protein
MGSVNGGLLLVVVPIPYRSGRGVVVVLRVERFLERGDTFAQAVYHGLLNLEFFARHQVHSVRCLGNHGFHVLLKLGCRAGPQQLKEFVRQISQRVASVFMAPTGLVCAVTWVMVHGNGGVDDCRSSLALIPDGAIRLSGMALNAPFGGARRCDRPDAVRERGQIGEKPALNGSRHAGTAIALDR